jgi:outer membrane immunogenic protein
MPRAAPFSKQRMRSRRCQNSLAARPASMAWSQSHDSRATTGRAADACDELAPPHASTVRGRVGYEWGPGVMYLTAGGAWENATVNSMLVAQTSFAFTSATVTSTFNDNKFGGVIGAGYEWMMAPNLTLRGEYLF